MFSLLTTIVTPVLITQEAEVGGKLAYEPGYDHGCDDADISDPDERYINQPEKGPSFDTEEFLDGYNEGLPICLSQIREQSDECNSFVNNTSQVDIPDSTANKSTYTGVNETVAFRR